MINEKLVQSMLKLPFDMVVQQLEMLEMLVGSAYKDLLVSRLFRHVHGVAK